MEIKGYFTKKGLALSAKLLTGAALTVTRVAAGGGTTADPAAATALPLPKQTLAVNTPTRSGSTATIPVTLAAALAAADYTLTELGVYARDPDEGEILYKVYRLDQPVDIAAGSRMVLRFYLEETVSQDLGVTVACSPAGLITETAFGPVRDKVMAAAVSTRVLSMDISQLQAFLDTLPRLLTEFLAITVSGTLEEKLTISSFYGPGLIRIQAAEAGCMVRQPILVSNCAVPVEVWNLQMEAPAGLPVNSALFWASQSRYVRLWGCTLAGYEHETNVRGVEASAGGRLLCEDCSVSGFYVAAFAGRLSSVLIHGDADSFSDNTYGAQVWRGGTVLLSGSVPDALGGAANLKYDGVIFKANGTLL